MDLTIYFHKVAALGQYCAPRARSISQLLYTFLILISITILIIKDIADNN